MPPNAAPPSSGIEIKMIRNCSPASSITISPDAAINSAVPRSGWVTIIAVGIAIMMPMISRSLKVGGSGRSCMYQAQIIGTASFMISEG